MIPDITPASQIDWDHAGARFYHVPFTLDHTWGRVRVPVYAACSTQPGPDLTTQKGVKRSRTISRPGRVRNANV